MLIDTHLRRAQLSKSYATLLIGGAVTEHTIDSVGLFTMRRICNERWAFLNKHTKVIEPKCPRSLRRRLARFRCGTDRKRCCRGPIRRHRSHQISSLASKSKSRSGIRTWARNSQIRRIFFISLAWARFLVVCRVLPRNFSILDADRDADMDAIV